MNKVVITAALTGPIATKTDHPGLPTTPEEIAAAAAAAYHAGAAVAHLHIRDRQHLPTADIETARRVLELVGLQSPILIQLSTGVGLEVPFSDREKLVELRPRMATLNPCTMSFGGAEFRNAPKDVRRLAERMMKLGVKAELEVYDSGHLDVCFDLLKEGLLREPLQFSIVMGVRGGMSATPENLINMVRRLPASAQWQAIAIGRANLQLTAIAVALGGNARTGLEDTLYLRKGELAPDNAVLVSRLAGVCSALERAPASIAEAELSLGL
jgi:3-keto-5-aminohexanoate cleavage enzyme